MVEFRDGHPYEDTEIPDGEYYTTKEFAALYDVPESTVRIWIKRRQVPCASYYGRSFIPAWAQINYHRPWVRQRRLLQRRVTQDLDLSQNF